MVHFAGPSQRNRAFAATALAFLMAGLSPAGAAAYTQDSWQSGYDVHQQTACWCVVASSLSWLNYVPGATHPSQSSLSAQITSTVDNSSQGDKYNWKAHSSGPCSDGSGTYGHDPRGEAWALYWHTPGNWFFNDYRYSSAFTADWELVYGIRGTGRPDGAIVNSGRHAILTTGYVTTRDPFSDGTDSISSFYVFDPYTNAHSNVPISTWNTSSWLSPNMSGYGGAGPFWTSYYVTVLQMYANAVPSDSPGETYGDWQASQYNGAAAAAATAGQTSRSTSVTQDTMSGKMLGPAITRPTVAAAVADGLAVNEVDKGRLGIDLTGYTLGAITHVDSFSPDVAPYELVEVRVGAEVRAVAMVADGPNGYTYAGASTLPDGWDLTSTTERGSIMQTAGLHGDGHLVWASIDGSNSPFTPFVHGQDGSGGDVYVDPISGHAYKVSTAQAN